jgi:hypothetical protein
LQDLRNGNNDCSRFPRSSLGRPWMSMEEHQAAYRHIIMVVTASDPSLILLPQSAHPHRRHRHPAPQGSSIGLLSALDTSRTSPVFPPWRRFTFDGCVRRASTLSVGRRRTPTPAHSRRRSGAAVADAPAAGTVRGREAARTGGSFLAVHIEGVEVVTGTAATEWRSAHDTGSRKLHARGLGVAGPVQALARPVAGGVIGLRLAPALLADLAVRGLVAFALLTRLALSARRLARPACRGIVRWGETQQAE